jgi:hypothetical protein
MERGDGRFWLFRWMDENRVRDLKDVINKIDGDPAARRRFRRLAEVSEDALPTLIPGDMNVVAGSSIDLSSRLGCTHPSCRPRQVQKLLTSVWHYFDKVVVGDTLTHGITSHWQFGRPEFDYWLITELGMFCFLRKIGADQLVTFIKKPIDERPGWRTRLRPFARGIKIPDATRLVRTLAAEVTTNVDGLYETGTTFKVEHPEFDGPWQVNVRRDLVKKYSAARLRRYLCERVADEFVRYLVHDRMYARWCKAPLGSAAWAHHQLLTKAQDPELATAIFSLDLPIMRSVSVPTLLKIRRDERDSFLRFQQALRRAFVEASATRGRGQAAKKIADQVRRDTIEPELRLIRNRLSRAASSVAKKSTVGIILGGLATTCGLFAGAAPAIALGAGIAVATATTSSAASRFIDDRGDVALSEMYFLWQALSHDKRAHRIRALT